MAKLVTTSQSKFGQKNVIPYAGEVQISDTGEIEVQEEHAQLIVDLEIGFDFLQEKTPVSTTTTTTVESTTTTTTQEVVTTTTQEPTTTTTTTEEVVTTTTQEPTTTTTTEEVVTTTTTVDQIKPQVETNDLGLSKEETDQLIKSIDDMKVTELQNLAKAFPRVEWEGLTKAPLQEYLKKKLTPVK